MSIAVAVATPQDFSPGRAIFESRCAGCHGADGNGGAFGQAIVSRLSSLNDAQLASFLRSGMPERSMPAFDLPENEMREVIVAAGYFSLSTMRFFSAPNVARSNGTTSAWGDAFKSK